MTLELELATVAAALSRIEHALPTLPADLGLWVAVSPATVCAPELHDILTAAVVPVTLSVDEHDVATNPPGLLAAANELRRAGVRLAVHGVAAGYSGLRHILRLNPDVVKLDRGLTHQIYRDLARLELARAGCR